MIGIGVQHVLDKWASLCMPLFDESDSELQPEASPEKHWPIW
jgi:hypothetical protein